MNKIIKYALIIAFVIGVSTFSYHCGVLKADKQVKSAQFEIIDFDFKIYIIRGHEYLGKKNIGLVHMADCQLCEK